MRYNNLHEWNWKFSTLRKRKETRSSEKRRREERSRENEKRSRIKRTMKGERGNQRARGGARSNGEGENLLAFYVSNYMKDGITQPTDRPTDRPNLHSPDLPFLPAPNQPTNARPPLSAAGRIPFSLRYSSLRLCPSCPLAAFSVSPHSRGDANGKVGVREREEEKEDGGERVPFYALVCAWSVSAREFNYIVRLNSPFLPPEFTPRQPSNVATKKRSRLRGLLGRRAPRRGFCRM